MNTTFLYAMFLFVMFKDLYDVYSQTNAERPAHL